MLAVAPSQIDWEELNNIIKKRVKKKGVFRKKPLESVVYKKWVWMPLYKIYCHHQSGNTIKKAVTVLNAMFPCDEAKKSEFYELFDPKLLRYKCIERVPRQREIVAPTTEINVQKIFEYLLELRNDARSKLTKIENELYQCRKKIYRYHPLLPILTHYLEREKKLSEEVAKLEVTDLNITRCLNSNENIDKIKVVNIDTFYYPILVVMLRERRNNLNRYLVIDLGGRISLNVALTKLCNKNEALKAILTRITTKSHVKR